MKDLNNNTNIIPDEPEDQGYNNDESNAINPVGENLPGAPKRTLRTLDEFGVVERFIDAHGDKVKYLTDSRELLTWDGIGYGKNPHIAERLAKEVINNLHLEFTEGEFHVDTDGKELTKADMDKFQAKARSTGMIKKTLSLLRTFDSINCEAKDFDADIYKLNCLNGLLDLETGEIEEHSPTQLVTKCAPVRWNSDAEAPAWEKFIAEVTCEDKELAAYLQRLVGYCLSGSTQEEAMPILYGNGANGKSILLSRIRAILGSREYALTLGTSSILNSNFHGIRADLRQLEGARVAFAIEVNRGATLDEAVIKALTGGDEISARAMRKNPVQFKAQAKILMAVNHLPGFTGNDRGIKRRLQVIPFLAEFDGTVRKEELEGKLAAESEGILVWAVAGFQEWRKQGLNAPEIVLNATEEYFRTNDHIGSYLDERTEKKSGALTPLRMAFEDYEAWANSACVKSVGLHRFGELMSSRGFMQKRNTSFRYWDELQLKHII